MLFCYFVIFAKFHRITPYYNNMRLLILSIILSLSADFTQVKEMQLMSAPQISEGHMTYRSPDFLRWEYTKPQSLVWEVDGEKTNVSRPIKGMIDLIMKSVSGEYLVDNESFEVQTKGNVSVLTPKKRDLKQFFQQITITLNPKTGIADKVEIVEKNGDKTSLTFHNIKQ